MSTRFSRALSTGALLAGQALLALSHPTVPVVLAQNTTVAPPQQGQPGQPGQTTPSAYRCPGFLEPGSPPDAEPGWELRWEWRWEIFSADPVFTQYRPMGIAIDADCNVYAGAYSPTGGRVVKLTKGGDTAAQWGTDGRDAGQFERLEGISVDGAGNVYAADAGNNRIQKLAPSGDVTAIWANRFRCAEVKVTCHVLPTEYDFNGNPVVAVDGAGTLYVGDSYQGVKKLSPTGAPIAMWPTALPESAIMQLSLDATGNLLLAHSKHKIVKQSDTGAMLGQWGTEGRGPGQFDYPNGVAADLEGNLYVADTDNQRIQKLSPSGDPIAQWGRCTEGEAGACSRFSTGDQAGEFAQPRAVAVNARGEVVVADHFNYRVQVYKAIPVWVRVTPPAM